MGNKGYRKKQAKKEARAAAAPAAQSSQTPQPLRVNAPTLKVKAPSANQNLLCKSFDIPFKATCIEDHGAYIDCDIGQTSYNGQPLTAIKCHTYAEVERCFDRYAQYGSYAFKPIAAYKERNKYLVIGQYVGEKFESWVSRDNNHKKLWTNPTVPNPPVPKPQLGVFTDFMFKVGKQVFEAATKHHQNNQCIGNIREGLCIDADGKVTFLPPKVNTRVEEGIRKDLLDLKWFLQLAYKPFEKTHQIPLSYRLFDKIYPSFVDAVNGAELKSLSYKLCHFPFFWGMEERYLFAEVLHKVYNEAKRTNGPKYFGQVVQIKEGITCLDNWWKKIKKLPLHDLLRKVYDRGAIDDRNYESLYGIGGFIRNSFEHYKEQDRNKTLADIDERILQEIPDLYFKIYTGMANADPLSNIHLDQRLQEGVSPLNYKI